MEQAYKKDGTSLKIMTEEDTSYINIQGKIVNDERINVLSSYVLRQVVYLNIAVVAGSTGDIKFKLFTDEKFYPHNDVYGFANCPVSSSDINKFLNIRINSKGELNLWIQSPLTQNEVVTFIYPLKS